MINKLRVSDVLKESYRIFRLHFTKIIILSVMIMLPVNLLTMYFSNVMENDNLIMNFQDKMQEILESGDVESHSQEILSYYKNMIPYVLISLILSIIAGVFIICLVKLTLDESRHGSLNMRRFDGDVVVVHENEEVPSVGSAFDYFSSAVRVAPKYIVTILAGCLLSMAGLFTFILPGILFAIVTLCSEYVVAIDENLGFKPLIKTGILILKNPALILYIAIPSIVDSVFKDIVIALIEKLGATDVVLVIVGGIATTLITLLLSLLSITTAVAFIDRNDIIMQDAKKIGRGQ